MVVGVGFESLGGFYVTRTSVLLDQYHPSATRVHHRDVTVRVRAAVRVRVRLCGLALGLGVGLGSGSRCHQRAQDGG